MKKPILFLVCITAILFLGSLSFRPISQAKSSTADEAKLKATMAFFATQYSDLNIPRLTLSYETALTNLNSLNTLKKQQNFFDQLKTKLDAINPGEVPKELRIEYDILRYEQAINEERINLSMPFVENKHEVTDKGIYHVKNGKAWYQFLVKHWTSGNMSPEAIALYGQAEVDRIKQEMKKIETSVPDFFKIHHSDKFLTNDQQLIQEEFYKAKKTVDQHLSHYFPGFERLPEVRITQGTNNAMVQVPAYYNNNTFYYNLFDQPFDLRQIDWLFIHEGNPGHHFQLNFETTIDVPAYRSNLSYGGFREGWAAYVENLGQEVGLYQTPYHYYSKWEWDLIRSVRLILDVGINYFGWTDAEAMKEWKKHIEGKDDIGQREITRMRRWPAQVLTYKVGAKAIREARQAAQLSQGDHFDLKVFHTKLLSRSSIPVQLIGASRFKEVTDSHLASSATNSNSMDGQAIDIDQDGDIDMILAMEFQPNLILINDGTGRLVDESRSRFPSAGHDSEDIAIADFDQDGDLDIVIVSEDDQINEYYENQGQATFVSKRDKIPVRGTSNAVETADLDGDGDMDLLIGNAGQNFVLINHNGSFKDESARRIPKNDFTTQDLELGDADGDGDLDLLEGNETYNRLLINDGNGFFKYEANRLPQVNDQTRDADFGDVDDDGDLDIFFSNVDFGGFGDPQNRLLINDGKGFFQEVTKQQIPVSNFRTVDADFVDLDGDGDLDLLCGNRFNGPSNIAWINDGKGFFSDQTKVLLPDLNCYPFDFQTADFNNDGKMDIYICGFRGSDILLFGVEL